MDRTGSHSTRRRVERGGGCQLAAAAAIGARGSKGAALPAGSCGSYRQGGLHLHSEAWEGGGSMPTAVPFHMAGRDADPAGAWTGAHVP